MRNRLIHAYFDVDHQTVWRVVKEHLPQLISVLGFEGEYFYCNKIKESGADPLNLQISSKKLTNAYSRLGVHLTIDQMLGCEQLCNPKISISLDLMRASRLRKASNDIGVKFLSFGDAFTTLGVTNNRNSFEGAITVLTELSDSWQIFAEAGGTYWGSSSTCNFLGGVKYSW